MIRRVLALVAAPLMCATVFASAQEPTSVWQPRPTTQWQIQLTGSPDLSVEAPVYELDAFDVPAETVTELHDRGRMVICYFNAGAFEDWRPDADDFPEEVKGKDLEGWPGERWLDIRRLDILQPIMEERLDLCEEKGFDAADFDNVDGYTQDSGFDISYEDQIAYNEWLAQAAEERGLAAALKNDLDQIGDLVDDFEFAVNEQCFQYRECFRLKPFVRADKAVFNIEYRLKRSQFCPRARELRVSAIRKRLSLGPWRRPCS